LAIRDRRRLERRVTASSGQSGNAAFVPAQLGIDPQNSRERRRKGLAEIEVSAQLSLGQRWQIVTT